MVAAHRRIAQSATLTRSINSNSLDVVFQLRIVMYW